MNRGTKTFLKGRNLLLQVNEVREGTGPEVEEVEECLGV